MDQEKFVKRLIELRLNKGVSARDMSLSLGQSAGYINNIENGINWCATRQVDILNIERFLAFAAQYWAAFLCC